MKRVLFITTTTLSLIAASSSFAGNLAEPVFTPTPAPMPAPIMQTSGDWSGFYVGGSLGIADVSDEANTFADDFDGLTYGAHAGYDYDFGSFVLGGELEISGFDVADSNTATEVDSVTRLKLRAGYDAGAFLPYVTAGVARLSTSGAPLGDVDDSGSFYGVGMDYKMTDNLRVGGEILQHDFSDYAASTLNVDALTAGVRVSFEF